MPRHQQYLAAARAALRRHAREEPSLTPELEAFAEKIARQASAITDADVAAMKRAGYSDDRLFELTVAVALESAAVRIDAGMAALEAAQR